MREQKFGDAFEQRLYKAIIDECREFTLRNYSHISDKDACEMLVCILNAGLLAAFAVHRRLIDMLIEAGALEEAPREEFDHAFFTVLDKMTHVFRENASSKRFLQ